LKAVLARLVDFKAAQSRRALLASHRLLENGLDRQPRTQPQNNASVVELPSSNASVLERDRS